MAGNPKKLAWARGRRWERKCLDWFRAAGFRASKFDETNGYCVGCDIHLEVYLKILHAWRWVTVPVAIQCKSTKEPRDLFIGLNEARYGWKKAKLFVCLHWLREDDRRGRLRIAHSAEATPGFPFTFETQMDAILEQIKAVIPTTEDTYAVLKATREAANGT